MTLLLAFRAATELIKDIRPIFAAVAQDIGQKSTKVTTMLMACAKGGARFLGAPQEHSQIIKNLRKRRRESRTRQLQRSQGFEPV